MSGVRSVSTVLWDMDRVPLEQLCEHHKIDQHQLNPFKDALLRNGYGKRFQAKEGPNGIPVGALVRYLLGKDQASLGEHVRATDAASQKESEDVVEHFSEYPELDELIKERVVRVRVMRMINQMIDRVVAGGEVLHSAAPTPHTLSMDATPVAGAAPTTSNASFPSEPMKVINTPVAKWLAEQGMERYAEAFHKEGFDEMEDLKSVAFSPPSSPEQTTYQSIVHLLGHREKIKRLITTTMQPTKEWVDKISNLSPGDDPIGSTAPSESESHRPSPSPSTFVDSAIVTMSAAQRESSASPGGASAFQALAAAAGSSTGTPASGVDLSRFVSRAPSHTVRVNGRQYDRRLLVATRGLRNPHGEGLKFCTDDKCLRRHLQYVVPANRKDNPFEIQAVCTNAPQFVLECDNIHAGFVRVKFKGRYAVWNMRWVSEVTEGLQKQLGSAPQMPRNRIIVCEESTCTFKERCSSGHFEVPVDGTPRNILDFGSTTALQLVMQQQWVDKLTLVKPSELQRGADDRSSLATEEYLALLDGDDDDHRISLHQHANRRNTNMSGLPVMRPTAGDCLAGTCDSFHFFGLCGRGAGCPCIHLASPAKSKLARGVFLRLHYDPLMEHFQSGEHQQVAAGNKLRSKNLQMALIDDVACLKDRMMRRRKYISVSEVGDVLVGTTCQVCRHAMFNLLKEVFNRSSCSLMGALCNRYGAIRTKKGGRDGTDPDLEDLMWNVKRYLDDQREASFEDDLAIHEPILLLNRAVVDAIQNHPPFPARILAQGQQLHMQPEIPVYWDFENVLITDKEELQLFISSVKALLCCEGIAFAESRVRIKAFGTQSVFNNVIDYVRDMQVEMVLCSDRKSEEVDRSIEKNIRETVLDAYRGSAYPAFVMITSDKDSIAIAEEGKAHGKQVFFIHDAPKGGNHERALMKASSGCFSLMDVYLSPFTKPEERMLVGAGGVARPQASAHHQPRNDPPHNAHQQNQHQQQNHQQQQHQNHQHQQQQQRQAPPPTSQSERSVMSFFQGGPPPSSSNVPPPRSGGNTQDNVAASMLREASGARAGAGSRVMNFGAKQGGNTAPPATQKAAAAIPASEPKVGDLLAMAMKLQQSKPASNIPAPKSQSTVKAVLTSKNQQPKQQHQQQAPAAPQQQQRHADPTPAASASSSVVDMSDVLGVLDPHFMPKRSSVAYYLLLVDALVLRILDIQKRYEEGGKKDPSLIRGPFKYTLPGRAKGQFDSKGSKIGGSTNLDPTANNNGKFNQKSGKKREDAFDRLNAETFELEDEAVVTETKEQKAATNAYRALELEYHQNVQNEMKAELSRFFTSAKAVMPPWFTATPDKATEKRCLGDLLKAPDTWLDMRDVVRRYPHAEAAAILRGKKRGLPPMVEMDTYRNALGVLRCIGNVVEGPIDGAPNLPTDLQRIVLQAIE